MKIEIKMSTRDGAAYATAIYDGEKVYVQPGGKISEKFATSIRGGANAKQFRDDSSYVDSDLNIIKECVFSSPSIAAQFVNGNSSNGYRVWKVNGVELGKYLEEKGIRVKK